MRLRREVGLGIGAMVVLQILLSLLAVALLTRMGPAVERILQENVYSEEAVEQMLAELASHDGADVPVAFTQALDRARDNVTEDPETPLLEVIEQGHAAAFAGDAVQRRAVVGALRELGSVNRDSMRRADVDAKRLGQAGAWAAAVLGSLALALGIAVYRRLALRIELPIEALRATARRARDGNVQARALIVDGPVEVRDIAKDLNWLLDQLMELNDAAVGGPGAQRDGDVRRVLALFLDRQPVPTLVLDSYGNRVSSNTQAMDLDVDDPGWTREPIEGTELTLATYGVAEPSEH